METVTSKDGTTIGFDRLGSGPPVVLVCGASVARGTDAPLAELLASDLTVYNYDRRGRGDSTDTPRTRSNARSRTSARLSTRREGRPASGVRHRAEPWR